VAVELTDDHLGYSWNLGFKTGQANTGVETFVFWRAGWLLQVHHCEARQPVVLRVGGFALPLRNYVGPALVAGPWPADKRQPYTMQFFSPDDRGTVLQPLLGFTGSEWDARLDDSTERRHVAAPYHATPVAQTARVTGPVVLAALAWAGADRAESVPWRIVSGVTGDWQLTHPKLGDWSIRHWSLPELI
jgi:hypothetical protein